MIETAAALDKLDDILSVPRAGRDLHRPVRPLALARLHARCSTTSSPRRQAAVEHILARAKAHGVVAGIHNGTPETALKRIAMGFRYVTVSSDARLMAAGSQQVLAKMRTTPPPRRAGRPVLNPPTSSRKRKRT